MVLSLFTSNKFVQFLGDPLWVIRLLTVDNLKLKFTKILLTSTSIFHLILLI
jgi:hypothetical protein